MDSENKEVVVTNITNIVWPLIEKTLACNYEELIESREFNVFCKAIYGVCLSIHECVLDGPNYDPMRIKKEPYLVYYFDDASSLFDWMCSFQSSDSVTCENFRNKIETFYEKMEHYCLIEKMNESIRKASLFDIRVDH